MFTVNTMTVSMVTKDIPAEIMDVKIPERNETLQQTSVSAV